MVDTKASQNEHAQHSHNSWDSSVVSQKQLPGRAIERAISSTAANKVLPGSDHGKDGNRNVGSMFNLDISRITSIAECEESAKCFVGSRLGS